MLFLVNCTVEPLFYIYASKQYERTHIVEAKDKEEAYSKVRKQYDEENHYVEMNYCNPLIS
jgi:hypothetical protein